jgi:hypothetical protein
MTLATSSEHSTFHICSHYAKRVNRSLMEREIQGGNAALAATLVLFRTSKELSG